MDSTDGVTALRGTIVTCRDDPFLTDPAKAFVTETDGAVICRNGVIEAVGPAGPLLASVPPANVVDHTGCLIAPGFIDAHVRYVQTAIVVTAQRHAAPRALPR
jgi:guanine deaminase